MKKIFIFTALIMVILVLVFIKDPNAQQNEALASMYDNVIVKNTENAIQQCHTLEDSLSQSTAGIRQKKIEDNFAKLVMGWKAVQATYIAGDLDQYAIDYPRYIDIFHIGNENINEQMQKVLKSTSEPKTALYKYSYNTINALEAILYAENTLSSRKLAIAQSINHNICERLTDILNVYQEKRNDFLSARDSALSMLANVLANQTLQLKDWRIGDPAGLTKKYLNQPDNRRNEYFLSGLSVKSINKILQTQSQLIMPQDYPNFVEIADIYAAQKQLSDAQTAMNNAFIEINTLNNENLQNTKLYQAVGKLQSIYYNDLIQALPVIAKILEADGD
ncbi:imelysin [Bisgaardia hudsonensis]|uniref:Imelysin n=1 Tax=Bisgaardia hudsonensis TaxID=109472 RepID=A0A4R2N0D0_9PAST|nr:imelysin family protein [Bisgaardia hudsonensis]QLB13399.1 hypothetical protein A6A11_07150 [Bisgaardia hudsonensis]TCP12803.1 imelysin [Bisgaardia hudsonensis]